MEDTLTQITNYLWTQSWQIAALAIVIAAVSLSLKNKSAHVHYLLWLIVLAKCLIPPLLTIPLAILPQEQLPEPAPIYQAEMPSATVETVETTVFEPIVLPSAPAVTLQEPTITERLAEVTVHQWLALGWIAGVVVFVFATVIRALRVNFWLSRERRPLPDGLQTGIENSFADPGVRAFPKVWLVEDIGQPFVWGLLRGGIYLPPNFANIDSDEHRRGVLGHELSHILRFDAAVNFLQVIAQAVFWFHPFVWWANKKIRAEREKCCDEMAIARFGAKARDYSTAIVNTLIAERESTQPVPSLAVAGPVKNIEDRIKTIMRSGKKFYRRPSVVVIISVLLLAALAVPTTLALTRRKVDKTDVGVEVFSSNALYQKQGSIRYVLEFIGVPEELIDTTVISKRGQLANPQQLEFANKLFSIRKSKDVDMFISLLSDGSKKQLKDDDNNRRVLHHRIKKIKEGTFLAGQYDFKFFATFREFTDEDWNTLKKHVSFPETPTHIIVYWHFDKPAYSLCGSSYYLIEDNGSYKFVAQTLLSGPVIPVKEEQPTVPKEYGIVAFKQTDEAYTKPAVWKYKWNIELSSDVSKNNVFQILRTTKVVSGQAELHPEIAAQKIIDESIIEKYKYDILKCRFYVGNSKPRYNYRKSGWAYCFSIASWSRSTSMLFPGKDVTNVKPNKQGNFVGSDLELLSFETSEENIRYEHKVILRKDDSPEAKSSALLRLEQMTRRQISKQKLYYLDKILTMYANDHNSKYPDRLDQIKPYDTDEWLDWLLENIEYVGKGITLTETANTVLAYDKTLLEKAGSTNVLFNEGPVQYCNPNWLKKLGITGVQKSDVQVEGDEAWGEAVDIGSGLSEMTDSIPNAIPTLRLEKPKYILGESIRFWVGVKCLDDDVRIPQKFWDSCFLYTTKPDGTVKKESVSWPIDGMLYRGWSGGYGLGKEKVQIGKYTLVFEFANKKTKPVELIVEEHDVIKNIKATFNFQRSGDISKNEHIPIILTVQNNSKHVIQFPRRGVSDAYVSIRVKRREPSRGADFFYPIEKLKGSLKNEYNWNRPWSVPPIILKLGERFEQELFLEDAYEFWGPGQYQVTFSTTLALVFGEKNGRFAEYNPVRLGVVATERFTVVERELANLETSLVKKPAVQVEREDWNIQTDLTQNLMDQRNKLVAEAKAKIHKYLIELARAFPRLERSGWGRILKPLEGSPGWLEIRLYHNQPKQGPDPTPKFERFRLTIDVRPPAPPTANVPFRPLYPNLGLVGRIDIAAGDPELDAALKKLVDEALEPLKQLDESLSDENPDVQVEQDEEAAMKARLESAEKLKRLGFAAVMYTQDHDGKYPDTLQELSKYDVPEKDLDWLLENIEYLGKGKMAADPLNTVIAYDKTLLVKGNGTNVLYNDTYVAFETPEQLEKLGLTKPAIAIESRFLLVPVDANEVKDFFEKEKFEFPGPNSRSSFLNAEQVQRFSKLIEELPGAEMLTAPKVTVLDGKDATLRVQRDTEYISGYTEPDRPSDEPQPKRDSVRTGTVLYVLPKITPDNKHILLEFDFELSNLIGFEKLMHKEKYPYEIPMTEIISLKTFVSVPNGGTLLIGGQKVKSKNEEDGRMEQKELLILIKAGKVKVPINKDSQPAGFFSHLSEHFCYKRG